MSKRSRRAKRRAKKVDREKSGRELTPRPVQPRAEPEVLRVLYTTPKPAPDKEMAWGIGTATALAVGIGAHFLFSWGVRPDPALQLFAPAMMGLMAGAAAGILWFRVASNNLTKESRRTIRKEGLRMCGIGIAGIAGVTIVVVGLLFWLTSIEAPVGIKTITALMEAWAAPFGAMFIKGLARLTVADEQSLNE